MIDSRTFHPLSNDISRVLVVHGQTGVRKRMALKDVHNREFADVLSDIASHLGDGAPVRVSVSVFFIPSSTHDGNPLHAASEESEERS